MTSSMLFRIFRVAVIATIAAALAHFLLELQNDMSKPKLNVHSFPRPPLLEKTPRHLIIKWGSNGHETVVADTRDAYWALETTHPPSMPAVVLFESFRCSKIWAARTALIPIDTEPFLFDLSILPSPVINLLLFHTDTNPREDIAV
jgi:hypothetical protein